MVQRIFRCALCETESESPCLLIVNAACIPGKCPFNADYSPKWEEQTTTADEKLPVEDPDETDSYLVESDEMPPILNKQ